MSKDSNLRGHVDRADSFLLAGWAICLSDPAAAPEVQVVQQGVVKVVLRANFSAPNLRSALGLEPSNAPPIYAWRLWLPLSNGIIPDVPFQVEFSNSEPLNLGNERIISMVSSLDEEAAQEIKDETFLFPSLAIQGESIRVYLKAAGPADAHRPDHIVLDINNEEFALSRTTEQFLFDKPVYSGCYESSKSKLLSDSRDFATLTVRPSHSPAEKSTTRFHNSVRSFYIPKTVACSDYQDYAVPALMNIYRVSGQSSNIDHYLAGGLTTFLQLNAMTKRYCGKSLFEFPTVVDWGVGCARVMRHFFEFKAQPTTQNRINQNVIGVDIDDTNIRWCNENMAGNGIYKKLSLEGFDINTASVDFLYGISVMTHLSEYHQHVWLNEISRILKPGGVAILTTHGEFVVYGEYSMTGQIGIMAPFFEKFGFFDGIPDNALGQELETYYRATYHSRQYVRQHWGRYFEILDIVSAANAFRQDFVVLRKPLH